MEMDRSAQLPQEDKKPAEVQESKKGKKTPPEPSPLIETRANIYDGDDFDVIEKDEARTCIDGYI